MATQLPVKALTRDQLAQIAGGNQEVIRRFEQLFSLAGDESPNAIIILQNQVQEVSIEASSAQTAADQALAALQSIADSLAVLAAAPVDPVVADQDFAPPSLPQLGTIASHNAETYTAPSANCTGAITTAAIWSLKANAGQVTLNIPAVSGAAGANTSISFGEVVPAKYRPAVDTTGAVSVTDNSVAQPALGVVFVDSGTGVITVYLDGSYAPFTNAGNAGITEATSITWTI